MRTSKAVGNALGASVAVTMLAAWSVDNSRAAPTSLRQSQGFTTQFPQQQAAQGGRLNGILALYGGIVSDYWVGTSSFMKAAAVGKPLVFVADYKGKVASSKFV